MSNHEVPELPTISWTEAAEEHTARWRSEANNPPPPRVCRADDTLSADEAYRRASEGTAFLWRGDFQNARQLLHAMARRIDRVTARSFNNAGAAAASDLFNRDRMAKSRRARTLGMILLPFDADYTVPLRRAPDVRQACREAYGPGGEAFVASMRELLGVIGAHEWRKTGIIVGAIEGRIHPHYGVFAPIRDDYVQLVAHALLPSLALAFDIGTGTGVLAAVLARRGVKRIIATDDDPRALACARENVERLDMLDRVEVMSCDLFPPGRAPLVLCNPPWIPARPSSPVERAIFDPGSGMLRGFLGGLSAHLSPGGEGWLILSDIAELLGLRTRTDLMAMIDAAGLVVVGREDVRPGHPKTLDTADPLHAARAAEVTSLWRLAAR